MKNKVKITLKYDDGRIKRTLFVEQEEFEAFLERDYQRRLEQALPEDRGSVKKLTIEEYVQQLNRESYNNWHKQARHKSGDVRNPNVGEEGDEWVNPIDLVADEESLRTVDSHMDLEALWQKLELKLSKKQVELLWKHIIDGNSVGEIAEQEGVSARAIYLRLETAKKRFKKFFQNPSLF